MEHLTSVSCSYFIITMNQLSGVFSEDSRSSTLKGSRQSKAQKPGNVSMEDLPQSTSTYTDGERCPFEHIAVLCHWGYQPQFFRIPLLDKSNAYNNSMLHFL